MKRGEIWTASATGYAGKTRPAIILQNDQFAEIASVTICVLTTHDIDGTLFRVPISPSDSNGLRIASYAMADKIVTIPRSSLGHRVGALDREDLTRLERAILVFLGFA